jgi:hypothetical protein
MMPCVHMQLPVEVNQAITRAMRRKTKTQFADAETFRCPYVSPRTANRSRDDCIIPVGPIDRHNAVSVAFSFSRMQSIDSVVWARQPARG